MIATTLSQQVNTRDQKHALRSLTTIGEQIQLRILKQIRPEQEEMQTEVAAHWTKDGKIHL